MCFSYQSRAFLVLPMCFNIGVILGPILGGALADPIHSFPHIFGPDSVIGGKDGVYWMRHWPYLLPNLLSATFIIIAAAGVILALDEVGLSFKNNFICFCSVQSLLLDPDQQSTVTFSDHV